MKFQVQYTSLLQEDITRVLVEKGLHVTWIDDTYELDSCTSQELDTVYALCQTGFRVNGVPVTVRILHPVLQVDHPI